MKNLSTLCAIGLVVAACGGGYEPNFGPETPATATQRAAIDNTSREFAAIANADLQGQAAAGAALEFALAAPALVNGAIVHPASGLGELDGLGGRSGIAQLTAPAALGACAVTTANSITWDHCEDQNGVVIDGSLKWSPGHVEIDLHVTGSNGQVQVSWSLTGSMTVSTTALQGDMTVAFDATAGGQHYAQTVRSQIDVQLDHGCIISGTLTVTATGNGQGSVTGAVQVIWSACNKYVVRNG
jgi:hypothetical protein